MSASTDQTPGSGEPQPRPSATKVPLGRLLRRGLTLACPACGARGHFRHWVRMNERCHRCGLLFERIEGHWIGAIGLNTIVSFGALLLTLVIGVVLTLPDIPVAPLMVANIGVAAVVPVVFYPASRTLWTAVDIAMRPLEAHEVDWTVVPG
jgi:uncharacterized protein (DUF983 family)